MPSTCSHCCSLCPWRSSVPFYDDRTHWEFQSWIQYPTGNGIGHTEKSHIIYGNNWWDNSSYVLTSTLDGGSMIQLNLHMIWCSPSPVRCYRVWNGSDGMWRQHGGLLVPMDRGWFQSSRDWLSLQMDSIDDKFIMSSYVKLTGPIFVCLVYSAFSYHVVYCLFVCPSYTVVPCLCVCLLVRYYVSGSDVCIAWTWLERLVDMIYIELISDYEMSCESNR